MKMAPRRSTPVGLLVRKCEDVVQSLVAVRDSGYNFVCAGPIASQSFVEQVLGGGGDRPSQPFTWFELALSSNEWSGMVVALLTDLETHLEGSDSVMSHRASQILRKEIEFVHHLSLTSIIVELKVGHSYANLARIVQEYAASATQSQNFWIKVPIGNNANRESDEDWNNDFPKESSWELWNKFRSLVNTEAKVHPSVSLEPDLPDDPEEIKRWLGEPVKAVYISSGCYTLNDKNYPVLNKSHQKVVRQFMELGAQIIIEPDPKMEITPEYLAQLTLYRQYIDYLATLEGRTIKDEYSGIQYTSGYEDYLQCPLQPLQDNLESHTYEVFEKDPVKYDLYADAVHDALLDLIPQDEKDTKTLVVMVVGAGRGPLVRASLSAAEKADRKIRLYAIEKNTNAANTLLHLNEQEWKRQVSVINVDMREWEAPELADILISELLGSFGDNELSPECLDGAQKFLKAGGISIPSSYTSYASPVMSAKLYSEVRKIREPFKNMYTNFETPYVVHMKNKYIIAEPEKVFHFQHPKPDIKESNERFVTLNYKAKADCVIHGFGGYFESTLYGKIVMSILPKSFSSGMFSWFPIFFPIRQPIKVKKGETITGHFWRCGNRSSVWYEWTFSSPVSVPIHNPAGRSYTIGL